MQGEYRLISSIAGKCYPDWFSVSFFLLLCRLVSSNVGEYVSYLLAILDCSVGRHQPFEFFRPVEDDVDSAQFLCCAFLHHQEALPIRGDVVVLESRRV